MIAVCVNKGMVDCVVTDDPALVGKEIMVLDYDIEGSDPEDWFKIRHVAFAHIDEIGRTDIDFTNLMEQIISR